MNNSPPAPTPCVAIVGAGWAGLSAACRLHAAGIAVTVFEAGHTMGGRARRIDNGDMDCAIDNGQHLLLGAYTETLALMHELDIAPERQLLRLPLTLQAADGSFHLRAAAPLPAPLHLLGAILRARGIAWRDKWRLVQALAALRLNAWRMPPGATVSQWLSQSGQSDALTRQIWRPLCLAAMNTPPEQACAQLFANVLRDSTGAAAWASDFLVPRVDLTALWPDYLPQGIAVQTGTPVRRLQSLPEGGVSVDGQAFDAVIVAANAPSTARLLDTLPPDDAAARYLLALRAMRFHPIATLTLALARPWHPPHPVLLLHDDPARHHLGQWLFDLTRLRRDLPSSSNGLLSIVISDARRLAELPQPAVVAGILEQLQAQLPDGNAMPAVRQHALIVEKRATFVAQPGLVRPANRSPWPGVWVAGDWTDTGYPAVLEGAVRSGRQAAGQVLQGLERR